MLTYFLQANVYAALFILIYAAFLREKDNHTFSRFYLLGTMIVALLLPFVKFSFTQYSPSVLSSYTIALPEISLTTSGDSSAMSYTDWLLLSYILIVAAMLVHLGMRAIALKTFLKAQKFETKDSYKIALNTQVGPASFGNIILFPNQEITPEILEHELAHLRSKHHYDKVFTQLLRCLAFPVIAIHYMIKELEVVHEFEADAKVITDKEKYARLLLNQHFDTEHFNLLQTFFHHPLKRRIIMLQKSNPLKPMKRAMVLTSTVVAIAGLVFMQSANNAHAQQQKNIPPKTAKTSNNNDEIFRSVEVMPEYPGGMAALQKYLATNLNYPEKARKDTLQGRITSQFVVGKDGIVKDIRILKSLSPECDAEVIRVIKAMPAWKPATQGGVKVNVWYTLPISFKLD